MRRFIETAAVLLLAVSATSAESWAQSGTRNGEWTTYGGDLGSTRYAPLDQIDASNFNELELAWRFETQDIGPGTDYNLQATPLMIDGVMYTTAGSNRSAVAIDAATGERLWVYNLDEGERARTAARQLSGRGVAYWADGDDERIFMVTIGYQLVGLDARTGLPLEGFGDDGVVDLKQGMDQTLDPITGELALNSAPVVARDLVIVGASHRPGGAPESRTNAKGYVRAFDVRTGERRWIFHTIPLADEFGNDTWGADSWEYSGNTGMWAPFSVDEELGMAYLPIELSTGDYYGGHRPGDSLFTESLVAVDLETGERIWHYQLVHHGIWDYDIPCAPILMDITVDGRDIKAVVQPSKQGWAYVFDRQTGEPVWPIEERTVEQSRVPGEESSGTQPFPTKPPPFELQGVQEGDLIDFTPELRAEALEVVSEYKLGPLFTPPIVRGEEGKIGMVFVPNGANWPGGSYDPETGIMYVFSNKSTRVITLVNDPERSDMDFINGAAGAGFGGGLTVQGLPIVNPPWGRITAIDMNRGDIVWQIPHGETLDAVRENPALEGVDVGTTGQFGPIGTLTTRTLVISGDRNLTTRPSGELGAVLHAYDKATGEEVGRVEMHAPQTGNPMTYMLNGAQYLVVAVGSATPRVPAELVAFRLP